MIIHIIYPYKNTKQTKIFLRQSLKFLSLKILHNAELNSRVLVENSSQESK
jgi:hypothetical protein